MRLRDAVAADVAATAEVAAASYRAAFAAILDPEVLARYDPAFFAARFAASLDRLRLAERDGRIIGFCLVTEAHIDMIFVAPDALGTGAGRALLADAQAHGASSLECFAANAPARHFYDRQGWRVTQAYTRFFAGRDRSFVRYEYLEG